MTRGTGALRRVASADMVRGRQADPNTKYVDIIDSLTGKYSITNYEAFRGVIRHHYTKWSMEHRLSGPFRGDL